MIQSKPITKEGLRSLYRSLIRLTNKLNKRIVLIPKDANKCLLDEEIKYNIDPTLYIHQLRFEIRYHARQEFAIKYSKIESLFAAVDRGNMFVDLLQNEDMSKFLKRLIEYRQLVFERQQRDFGNDEETSPQRTTKNPSLAAKSKAFKQNLGKANEYAQHLLRRYIKQKQSLGLLPSPQRLPYTPERAFVVDIGPKKGIPESNKSKAMKAAFSFKYIDAIIKPGLAYDINKYHYLNKLETTVNTKGPANVKIGVTNAGPVPIPFIKLPYLRKPQLEEVAMDIKKLMTAVTIRGAWEGNSLGKVKTFKDGSMSIRRSQGFGEEEIMFPRSYYEELAVDEAMWEYLLEPGLESTDLPELTGSWTEALDITSEILLQKFLHYRKKYENSNEIHQEVRQLQKKHNAHFDKLLIKYQSILDELTTNNVHKHSEIVNGDKILARYRAQEMYGTVEENIDGIPQKEGYGLGKNLGDYLKQLGYHSFRFGNRFYDRFKFKC